MAIEYVISNECDSYRIIYDTRIEEYLVQSYSEEMECWIILCAFETLGEARRMYDSCVAAEIL